MVFLHRNIAGFSSLKNFSSLSKSANSAAASLLAPPRAVLRILSCLLFTASISARISSSVIVCMSAIGSILLLTCVIFASSKQRTTWTIASHSRTCDKNLLPKPSPLDAPLTRPAISTNSTIAGVTFLLL